MEDAHTSPEAQSHQARSLAVSMANLVSEHRRLVGQLSHAEFDGRDELMAWIGNTTDLLADLSEQVITLMDQSGESSGGNTSEQG